MDDGILKEALILESMAIMSEPWEISGSGYYEQIGQPQPVRKSVMVRTRPLLLAYNYNHFFETHDEWRNESASLWWLNHEIEFFQPIITIYPMMRAFVTVQDVSKHVDKVFRREQRGLT